MKRERVGRGGEGGEGGRGGEGGEGGERVGRGWGEGVQIEGAGST